jgi:hypothetical protein
MLILGDAISSVSVLILEGQKLRTLARDYTAMWPVSVGALDDKTVISANVPTFFSTSFYPITDLWIDNRLTLIFAHSAFRVLGHTQH